MAEPLGATLAPGAARALACPSCGAAVALRAMDWTQTVACASCGAVLDAGDPGLRVLQEAQRRMPPPPRIPLGTRGRWRGGEVEAVGVREQEIRVEGARYAWREYVLFNPYRGFRYLVEYDGHWTDVAPLADVPAPATEGGRPAVRLGGAVYRHFQTATARTAWVLGEFPWEARAGDAVESKDYVAPPVVLSAEEDAGAGGGAAEVTWSRGEYVDGRAVWQAFGLDGAPPVPRGVYANQPSPHAGAGGYWRLFAALALLLVAAACARFATAGRAEVFSGQYLYTPGAAGDGGDAGPAAVTGFAPAALPNETPALNRTYGGAFVTPAFTLGGPLGLGTNVELETRAWLDNQWMAVEYSLVDEASGRVYDTARELGYYTGADADGPWTEGSRLDRVRLGPIPPGRYFLRVEPTGGQPGAAGPVAWAVAVRRDVPSLAPFLLALLALAVPPAVAALRSASFEYKRWQESDYAISTAPMSGEEE